MSGSITTGRATMTPIQHRHLRIVQHDLQHCKGGSENRTMKQIGLIALCGLLLSLYCYAKSPDVSSLIKQLYESTDIHARRRAAKVLGEIGTQPIQTRQEIAGALIAAWGDEDESLKYYASQSLQQIQLPPEAAVAVWVKSPLVGVENWLGVGSVPLLGAVLNGPDSVLRDKAVQVLYSLGPAAPAAAVPALIKALRNPAFRTGGEIGSVAFPFHTTVSMALAEIGEPAVDDLLTLLHDTDADVSGKATMALSAILSSMAEPPAAITPALLDLLQHGDASSRQRAILLFAAMGKPPKAAVPLLIDALSQSLLKRHRRKIVKTLGAIGPDAQAAVPVLMKLLDDNAASIRADAIEALGKIGPAAQAALPAIQEKVYKEAPVVRYAVIPALRRLGAPLPASQLRELLYDEDNYARKSALEELGKVPFDEAIPILIEAPHPQASTILAEMAPAVLPALIEALTDPNENKRFTAALALSQIQSLPKTVVPALIKVLGDAEINRFAAIGLARSGTPEALNALIEILNRKDGKIRFHVAAALAKLESPPQETELALIAVLGDKYEPIHRNVVIALRKIGTPEALQAVDRVELGLK